MTYIKTEWVNESTPAINAVNLNKIEQGIADAHTNLITSVTDTYQILDSDETVVCNKASAFAIKLPTGTVGQLFHIKNIGAGVVTLEGATGAASIDGETNQLIYQWDSLTVQYNSTNSWVIV